MSDFTPRIEHSSVKLVDGVSTNQVGSSKFCNLWLVFGVFVSFVCWGGGAGMFYYCFDG